jgi:hypothetical protein
MENSYQISVKNRYLAFNFQLAGDNSDLVTKDNEGFTVKTLKKKSADILDKGMECIISKDGKDMCRGTVSEIKPLNKFLFLKCTSV